MTTVRSGVMAQVWSASPSKEYGSPAKVALRSGTPGGYGFLQFGLPSDLHAGATVTSARVLLTQDGTSTGTPTLTLRTVDSGADDKWAVSKVNWNNQPGATGTARTKTQAGANGTVWAIDDPGIAADVQAWVNGAPNRGWRVATSVSSIAHFVRGFSAASGKPVLELEYTYAPAAPTSLHPSAGAVSIAKPVLRFDSSGFVAVQVQIDAAADGVTPDYDTGTVSTTLAQLDTARTDLPGGVFAGITLGTSTQWRVRVLDYDGVTWSPWSQWATVPRTAKAAATIAQPTGTIWESSPPFDVNMTGITSAMQWFVARADNPSVVLYDSGYIPTTDGQHTPPLPVFLTNLADYVVTVWAWDNVVREATPGDPPYVVASVTTTLEQDPGTAGVEWISVTQATLAPWVDVTFSRAEPPDGWAIIRDDQIVHIVDDYSDLLVSGDVYTWRDWTAAPNRAHVWRAAPIVNGKISSEGPTETYTILTAGLWLGDPEKGLEVVVWNDDAGSWAHGEDAITYYPIGSPTPVREVVSMRGFEGQLSGQIYDHEAVPEYPAAAVLEAWWSMKSDQGQTLRLVAGSINKPVIAYDVNPFPDPLDREYQPISDITFGVTQTGEYDFVWSA